MLWMDLFGILCSSSKCRLVKVKTWNQPVSYANTSNWLCLGRINSWTWPKLLNFHFLDNAIFRRKCFTSLLLLFLYSLFFDDYRLHLVNVLHAIMKPKGEAIIFAPKRGKTFEAFEEAARSRFRVCRTEQYDEDVWKYHQQVKWRMWTQ